MSSFTSSVTAPAIHTLIVAAGKGSRFGASIPKQYTQLAGLTILEHSVRALSNSSYINDIHLVVAEDDNKALTLDFEVPVHISIGGAERWQSVKSGVEAIKSKGAHHNDLVLIHDAARPCIQSVHIDAVINAAKSETYGAILGVPVADTVKRVIASTHPLNQSMHITETVDRHDLWLAQTPQVYRLHALYEVLNKVANDELTSNITDEASAFEQMGYPVRMVQGSPNNIKLTYQEDLKLIQALKQQ